MFAAVAPLGYPVKEIKISPYGFPCGVPFPAFRSPAPGCPPGPDGPTAYVTFFGTDKVAGLTIDVKRDGSLAATIIAFEVPPTGPAPA